MSSNSDTVYLPLTPLRRQKALTKLDNLWLDTDDPNHEKTFYEPTWSLLVQELDEILLADVIKHRAIRKLARYYQIIRDKKTQLIDESLFDLLVPDLLPIINDYNNNKESLKRKISEDSSTQETRKKYRT